jgi:hypothetical protein
MHDAEQFNLPLPGQPQTVEVHKPDCANTVGVAAAPISPERGHHRYGMSTLNYLAACSGFLSRNTSSEAADDGTRLHSVMERIIDWIVAQLGIMSSTQFHMEQLASRAYQEIRHMEALSDEEEFYIEFCCRELDKWLRKVGPEAKLLKEQRVHIHNPDGTQLHYGHYDLLIFISDEVGLLFDWKFGWIPVPPAQNNWQGKGYAVGSFQTYPRLKKLGVVFVQPKLHRSTYTTYARESMFDMWREIHGVIAAAQAQEKKLTPGQYCDYCGGAATCSALLNEANRAVAVYEGLPVPAGFTGLQITSAEDAARAMYLLDRLKVLLDRADELKDKAKEFAKDNGGLLCAPLPDGKLITVELKTKSAARSANSPGMIAEVLKDYLTPEQVLGACDPKITALEEIFADAFVARQAEAAQALLAQAEADAQALRRSGDLTGAAQTLELAKHEAKTIRTTKKQAVSILSDMLTAEGLLSRPEGRVEYLKVRIEKPVTKIKTLDSHVS